jgi:NAD(P)-dependent dehydrogenase (short-subunit alcohol dehydrogenase family)
MKRANWGRIIFISSKSALQIPVEMIHYGVTKTAQIALARGLAEAVAGTGITVNSVLPGPTKSRGVVDFVGVLSQSSGKSFEEFETVFLRRICGIFAGLLHPINGFRAGAADFSL